MKRHSRNLFIYILELNNLKLIRAVDVKWKRNGGLQQELFNRLKFT